MMSESDCPNHKGNNTVKQPIVSEEMLAMFARWSVLERLQWLDETYAFLNGVADAKTKELWKQFRAGDLK